MAQVGVDLKTIDLRKANLQGVEGKDRQDAAGFAQHLPYAGDVGEDGTPDTAGYGGLDSRCGHQAGDTSPSRRQPRLTADAIVGPLTWKKLIQQDF